MHFRFPMIFHGIRQSTYNEPPKMQENLPPYRRAVSIQRGESEKQMPSGDKSGNIATFGLSAV
jgi:hypothetical protein